MLLLNLQPVRVNASKLHMAIKKTLLRRRHAVLIRIGTGSVAPTPPGAPLLRVAHCTAPSAHVGVNPRQKQRPLHRFGYGAFSRFRMHMRINSLVDLTHIKSSLLRARQRARAVALGKPVPRSAGTGPAGGRARSCGWNLKTASERCPALGTP